MESPSSDVQAELNALEKLGKIRHAKDKTTETSSIKSELLRLIDLVVSESKTRTACKSELEQIQQEKMKHVEELRQIHADENLLETTIRQSEDDSQAAVEKIRVLTQQLETSRGSICRDLLEIGIDNEIIERLENQLSLDDEQRQRVIETVQGSGIPTSVDEYMLGPTAPPAAVLRDNSGLTMQAAAAALLEQWAVSASGLPLGPSASTGNTAMTVETQNVLTKLASTSAKPLSRPLAMGAASTDPVLNMSAEADSRWRLGGPSGVAAYDAARASAMRGQPPPMKSCLSCHQQIHRNAPICPLCKAKSRSRNPKKPKGGQSGSAGAKQPAPSANDTA